MLSKLHRVRRMGAMCGPEAVFVTVLFSLDCLPISVFCKIIPTYYKEQGVPLPATRTLAYSRLE